MKRVFEILACLLLVAGIAFFSALTWALIRIEPKAAATLDSVKKIEQNSADVLSATYATEGEIANFADTLNGIASGLSDHEAAELQATQDLSTKLSILADHADADVTGLRDMELATTDAIKGIAEDSHATLGAVQATLGQASEQISNPAIAESLEEIRKSTASTAQGTAELAATMTDVRQVADHYRAQALKPVSTAKRIVIFLGNVAGSVIHGIL